MNKILTEHAALLRLNRKLKKDQQKVCRSRFSPVTGCYGELGRFYVVDESIGAVIARDIDLSQWMKEAGVLKNYEAIQQAN
ncbi:TPA: hypothetical protein ACSQ1O_001304 [Aeromonas hydrophila]|nr:hypothetical protein [Aeromonas hydrophila]MCR3952560.1 hypothetical protein [Aeromonas hydrophila]QWL80934.1 hypothetical protein HQ395_20435 [Aeromonas hydrophila]